MENSESFYGVQTDEDTQKDRYLIFVVDNQSYGIEIKSVNEIIGIQKITEVPEVPDYIKGVINLRGQIIPVMDVRIRFKKKEIPYNERTCIIIIKFVDISVGLIVDSVSEVLSISQENIMDPPKLASPDNKFVSGIGKIGDEVRLIIDCDRILNEKDTAGIAGIEK